MSQIQLQPAEIELLLKDEDVCWKLHRFHIEQAQLSKGSYRDQKVERQLIAGHTARAKAWEDHVNDCIES